MTRRCALTHAPHLGCGEFRADACCCQHLPSASTNYCNSHLHSRKHSQGPCSKASLALPSAIGRKHDTQQRLGNNRQSYGGQNPIKIAVTITILLYILSCGLQAIFIYAVQPGFRGLSCSGAAAVMRIFDLESDGNCCTAKAIAALVTAVPTSSILFAR